jgi:hypothetical protein
MALLRGELDWVVMKCLEKDRTRRYATANALAMDIDRYLREETVLARPPSQLYRLQKLVRRNRMVFLLGESQARFCRGHQIARHKKPRCISQKHPQSPYGNAIFHTGTRS